MSAGCQGTKRRKKNIGENFNRLSRVNERYRQTDGQIDGRTDGRTDRRIAICALPPTVGRGVISQSFADAVRLPNISPFSVPDL